MPIVLHEHRIVFFNVPKVASTSLKAAIYFIEHGRPFQRAEHGTHVHRVVREDRFGVAEAFDSFPDYWKFAVVRDPIRRLLSAYANRVVDQRDHLQRRGARVRLLLRGLWPNPGVDFFFRNLGRYRAANRSIRHHTDPLRTFLGPDLGRLDRVYRLEELPHLEATLRERTGLPVELPQEKRDGTKVGVDDVAPDTYERLLALTAEEYRMLDGFYAPPRRRAGAGASIGQEGDAHTGQA